RASRSGSRIVPSHVVRIGASRFGLFLDHWLVGRRRRPQITESPPQITEKSLMLLGPIISGGWSRRHGSAIVLVNGGSVGVHYSNPCSFRHARAASNAACAFSDIGCLAVRSSRL